MTPEGGLGKAPVTRRLQYLCETQQCYYKDQGIEQMVSPPGVYQTWGSPRLGILARGAIKPENSVG